MSETVLVHVQHFQGMGHLIRAFALAGELASRFRVVVASGGHIPPAIEIPPGIEIVALPVLEFDENKQLASTDGTNVAEVLAMRRQALLDLYDQLEPSVVLIELFPFGRKKLAKELLPLLERARSDPRRPVIACSIRDILVTGRIDQPKHDARAATTLDRFFDVVLVHGDPDFVVLEDSFSPPQPITVPVRYTGFIARKESSVPAPAEVVPGSVVVSAGGGWVGGALMRAAIDAHAILWERHRLPMTLISGPLVEDSDREEIRSLVADQPGITLIPSVPDLLVTLRTAAVSVSQCGYNTTMDLLRARIPAVVVPFGDERENEQPRRGEHLAKMGLATVVSPTIASGETLADAVTSVLGTTPTKVGWSIDGAARTATILTTMLASASPRSSS